MAEKLEVLTAVISPADVIAADAGAPRLLDRSWRCRWGDGPTEAWSLSDEDRAMLEAFLPKLSRGDATWADMHQAAPILSRGLALPHGLLGGSVSTVEVEIRSAEDERVLTELPWEIAAATLGSLPPTGEPLFDHLAGRLPLLRVAEGGAALATELPFRPSVLWCISNPPGAGYKIDLAAFSQIFEQTFAQFPYLLSESLAGLGPKPLWSSVKAEILRRKPNIFVLVAHGDSSASGSDPVVYFQDPTKPVGGRQVPVRELAGVLRDAGSVWIGVLICCDLVRSSAYSAALELIRCGTPEVVAMQGKINLATAKAFLDGFLGDLLVRHSTAMAVAAGRRAAAAHPHACLPALFASAAQRGLPNPLFTIEPDYDAARKNLEARVLSAAPYLERPGTEKRPLEPALAAALCETGLLVVLSALGDGGTELIKACVRMLSMPQNRGRTRPILYVNLAESAPHEPVSGFIARVLSSELQANPVLVPLGVEVGDDPLGATQLLQLIDRLRLTLIIDHVPAPATEEVAVYWSELVRGAAAYCPAALVCIAPRGLDLEAVAGDAAAGLRTFPVPPLSLQETAAYAKRHLNGADPERLLEQTGGKPLFLDATRQRRLKDPGADVMAITRHAERGTVARYLSLLEPALSPEAVQAMFAVACLAGIGTREGVIEQVVGPEGGPALDELLETGIVHESRTADGERIVYMPAWTRDALREGRVAEVHEARLQIAERFRMRDEADQEALISALAPTEGGAAVIECIQRSLGESGDWDLAVMIALYGDLKDATDSSVLFTYEAAFDIMRRSGKALAPDPELLLNAISRAQNLGRNDRVERLFAEFLNAPAPYDRARALAYWAIWLKDTEQASRLDEIEDSFQQALELADSSHASDDDDSPTAEEWTDLRRRILLSALQARLFLNRETYATVPERYRQLLNEMADSPDKAVLLCMFAEREMREPEDRIDWATVADWLVAADAMLHDSGDDRAKTYCAYQYGQYLRERSIGDGGRAAHERYVAADETGRRSGERRRWGLARLRRVELLLDNPALEVGDGDAKARARELLDEVLSGFPFDRGDALAARVRGLLCALRADLASAADERRFRHDAATAFAAPMLRSASDGERFLGQMERLLSGALDESTGDFRYAQQLLFRFRERLEQLGLKVDLEAPGALLAGIRSIIEENRERGT